MCSNTSLCDTDVRAVKIGVRDGCHERRVPEASPRLHDGAVRDPGHHGSAECGGGLSFSPALIKKCESFVVYSQNPCEPFAQIAVSRIHASYGALAFVHRMVQHMCFQIGSITRKDSVQVTKRQVFGVDLRATPIGGFFFRERSEVKHHRDTNPHKSI